MSFIHVFFYNYSVSIFSRKVLFSLCSFIPQFGSPGFIIHFFNLLPIMHFSFFQKPFFSFHFSFFNSLLSFQLFIIRVLLVFQLPIFNCSGLPLRAPQVAPTGVSAKSKISRLRIEGEQPHQDWLLFYSFLTTRTQSNTTGGPPSC